MERIWASSDRLPGDLQDDSKSWSTTMDTSFNLSLWDAPASNPMAPLDFDSSIPTGHDSSTFDLWSHQPAHNSAAAPQPLEKTLSQPVLPSLTPDGDEVGSSCSTKTCGLCCEVANESQGCKGSCESKVCDGYIDCEDPQDCPHSSVEEACHEDKSVCFDTECLREEGVAEDVKFADFADNVSQPGLVMLSSHREQPFPNLNSWIYDQSSFPDLFQEQNVPGAAHSPRYPLTISIDDVCAAEGLGNVQRSARAAKRRKHDQPSVEDQHEKLSDSVRNSISSIPDSGLYHNVLSCQWGNGCDDCFTDRVSLGHHVFHQHVEPQIKIQQDLTYNWEDFQQNPSLDIFTSHVKRIHSSMGPQDFYTCMSPGCDAQFLSEGELVQHLKTIHAPPSMFCQWDQCGAQTLNMNDMAAHLHKDHCLENTTTESSHSPKTSISPDMLGKHLHVCQWIQTDKTEEMVHGTLENSNRSQMPHVDEEPEDMRHKGRRPMVTCNQVFKDAEQLQNHVKNVHIAVLRKKPNYVCRWHNCQRRDHAPFSQKGKLERHLQVHTLCMFET